MKFSYRLLKKIYPNIPPIKKTAELLTAYLFETAALDKNVLDVQVLPNRYSDAASHWGLARELSAIMGKKFQVSSFNFQFPKKFKNKKLKVDVKTPKCRRMIVYCFDNITIGSSPRWLKDILKDIGAQSINNLVDITNYATAETGQPLHAFDLDKMEGNLIVRSAKNGERVISLDGKERQLDDQDTVLADSRSALDVAGIKGGKKAEITETTKRILLTAGNFAGAGIYKTSRKIGLATDASIRFSHDITPELAMAGINRAAELIEEFCGGKLKAAADVYREKFQPSVHKFDIKRFNRISGLNLGEKEAIGYLSRLGFKSRPGHLMEAPVLRTDIERFEDLAEEITRLYGYQNLPASAPRTFLKPAADDEQIVFQNKIKTILAGFGLDEAYNYSLLPEELSEADAVAVANPVSRQFTRLRSSLLPLLSRNVEDNYRFFERVAIFEIGQVFQPDERPRLGIMIAAKKEKTIFELKGVAEGLLERLGLTDYFFREDELGRLRLESDHTLVGYVKTYDNGQKTAAELDLNTLIKLVEGEKSYEPPAKYPAITRDLSFITSSAIKFSDIMSLIENAAPKYLDDVDLVDSYEDDKFGAGRRSLTLRLVFQAGDRTLTEAEVGKELAKIIKALTDKLNVEIR